MVPSFEMQFQLSTLSMPQLTLHWIVVRIWNGPNKTFSLFQNHSSRKLKCWDLKILEIAIIHWIISNRLKNSSQNLLIWSGFLWINLLLGVHLRTIRIRPFK